VSRRLLVVTTVHQPDDPRIREKLIRSLSGEWEITYACQDPGPTDTEAITWVPLHGGRAQRLSAAMRICLIAPADVIVLHDPELIPIGMLARTTRRIPVVFDLHENLPAQLATRRATPAQLRRASSGMGSSTLRAAEGVLEITLAESGYGSLFRAEHPVFPNYPDAAMLPDPSEGDGSVVYVGDVTEARGAAVLVEAVARTAAKPPLVLVGRIQPELDARMRAMSAALGVDLTITGWRPYREAMEIAAGSGVAVSPLLDLPNYRESLPTKTLEYLALGVPVVASDLRGTRAAIGDLPGVTLVTPGESAPLAAAIDETLADPASRLDARQAAGEVRRDLVWPTDRVRTYYRALVSS